MECGKRLKKCQKKSFEVKNFFFSICHFLGQGCLFLETMFFLVLDFKVSSKF